MKWGRIQVLLGLLFLGRPLPSPGLQATLGLEYDDNPFEKGSLWIPGSYSQDALNE